MLTYSLIAPKEAKPAKQLDSPTKTGLVNLFLLGVSVTFLELPTAFPYFGAIAILTNASLKPLQWLLVLVVYNLIFVLPPILLLMGHVFLGKRLGTSYVSLRERLQCEARETMLWIIGIVGFFLLADSLSFFEFFGLVGGSA